MIPFKKRLVLLAAVLRDKELARSLVEIHLSPLRDQRDGGAVSRETLLSQVWGYGGVTSSRTVDVHVAWLRQKLEADPRQPQWILTVHGLGYRLAGGGCHDLAGLRAAHGFAAPKPLTIKSRAVVSRPAGCCVLSLRYLTNTWITEVTGPFGP